MKIYHGTSSKYLGKILKEGLKPRLDRSGNWEKFPSIKDFVYLTVAYPFYFANAAIEEDTESMLVLEIDLDKLDKNEIYPDEDVIAQSIQHNNKDNISIDAIQEYVKQYIGNFKEHWEESIRLIGNCAYNGIIPLDAISRYALVKTSRLIILDPVISPSISIMNYRFKGKFYRDFISWIFGEREYHPLLDETKEYVGVDKDNEDFEKEIKRKIEFIEKESKNRQGISVVCLES